MVYSPDTLNAVHPKWNSRWSSPNFISSSYLWQWPHNNHNCPGLKPESHLFVIWSCPLCDWWLTVQVLPVRLFPLVSSLAFPKYFLGLTALWWTGLLLRPFPLSGLFCGMGSHPCSISTGFDQASCLANRMLIGPWSVLTQMCLYSCAPVLGRLSWPAEDWHALAKWL